MPKPAYKYLQRRLYTFLNSNFGFSVVFIGCCLVLHGLIGLMLVPCTSSHERGILDVLLSGSEGRIFCSHVNYADNIADRDMERHLAHEPIDVVYTWVNGSDPVWQAKKQKFKADSEVAVVATVTEAAVGVHSNQTAFNSTMNGTAGVHYSNTSTDATDAKVDDTSSSNRYRDSNELRYSLRSLEKYAPWIRRIFLVTDNQIPHWLNLENPKIEMVSHEEIFPNKSHLPVFSSPAIESHLHRIPGLSRRFVYFNDDVFLGAPVSPDDFVSVTGTQRFVMSWDVPKCAPGCADSWIGDGYCDKACNVSTCNFDYPDCLPGNVNKANSNSGRSHPSSYGSSQQWQCSQGCPEMWLADKVCDMKCKTLSCGFDLGDCGLKSILDNYPGATLQPVLRSVQEHRDVVLQERGGSSTLEPSPATDSGDGDAAALSYAPSGFGSMTPFSLCGISLTNVTDGAEILLEEATATAARGEGRTTLKVQNGDSSAVTANVTGSNATAITSTPTTNIVLRIPYGSSFVVHFNTSLLACATDVLRSEPFRVAKHELTLRAAASSDFRVDKAAAEAGDGEGHEEREGEAEGTAYVHKVALVGSSSGSGPVPKASSHTEGGDESTSNAAISPWSDAVMGSCNLTSLLDSGAFAYTAAEFDVDGTVHVATMLSRHHTLAVILFHEEYPQSTGDALRHDPPPHFPYDTTFTIRGFNSATNISVSASFVLRIEAPLASDNTAATLPQSWMSAEEQWYHRMPLMSHMASKSPALAVAMRENATVAESFMAPVAGYVSKCNDKLTLTAEGRAMQKAEQQNANEGISVPMRTVKSVGLASSIALLHKPYATSAVYEEEGEAGTEGIALLVSMATPADLQRQRDAKPAGGSIEELEARQARVDLEEALVDYAANDAPLSQFTSIFTVVLANGEERNYSVPLVDSIGAIDRYGNLLRLSDALRRNHRQHVNQHPDSTAHVHGAEFTPAAPVPDHHSPLDQHMSLQRAARKMRRFHTSYSTSRKWRGTQPHADPLTRTAVAALTSQLLSPDPNAAGSSGGRDGDWGRGSNSGLGSLIVLLPLPHSMADSDVNSWVHVHWELLLRHDGEDADVGEALEATTAVADHSTVCACAVISFRWGVRNDTAAAASMHQGDGDVIASSESPESAAHAISSAPAAAHNISIVDGTDPETEANFVDSLTDSAEAGGRKDPEPATSFAMGGNGTSSEAEAVAVHRRLLNRRSKTAATVHSASTKPSAASHLRSRKLTQRRKISERSVGVEVSSLRSRLPLSPRDSSVTVDQEEVDDLDKVLFLMGRWLKELEKQEQEGKGQYIRLPGVEGKTMLAPVQVQVDAQGRRRHRRRKLIDTYGQSLIHVNRLYNQEFGTVSGSRKVPAHVPHMIDRTLMDEMQRRWAKEWNVTSANRFRSPTDMQYSFAYYYYVINRQKIMSPDLEGYLSQHVDTNGNGVVDDNEYRTLVAIINGGKVPVTDEDVLKVRQNCSDELIMRQRGASNSTSDGIGNNDTEADGTKTTPPLESAASHVAEGEFAVFSSTVATRHFPSVKELAACPAVASGVVQHAAWYNPSPAHVFGSDKDVAFEMIGDNATETLKLLDSVRARQSKFICINDNIQAADLSPELDEIIRDFFRGMYPKPSAFELLPGERNPTLYTDEYRERFASWRYHYRRKYYKALNAAAGVRHSVARAVRSLILKALHFVNSGGDGGDRAEALAARRKEAAAESHLQHAAHYAKAGHRYQLAGDTAGGQDTNAAAASASASAPVAATDAEQIIWEYLVVAIATSLVAAIALLVTCGCRSMLNKDKKLKRDAEDQIEGEAFAARDNKATVGALAAGPPASVRKSSGTTAAGADSSDSTVRRRLSGSGGGGGIGGTWPAVASPVAEEEAAAASQRTSSAGATPARPSAAGSGRVLDSFTQLIKSKVGAVGDALGGRTTSTDSLASASASASASAAGRDKTTSSGGSAGSRERLGSASDRSSMGQDRGSAGSAYSGTTTGDVSRLNSTDSGVAIGGDPLNEIWKKAGYGVSTLPAGASTPAIDMSSLPSNLSPLAARVISAEVRAADDVQVALASATKEGSSVKDTPVRSKSWFYSKFYDDDEGSGGGDEGEDEEYNGFNSYIAAGEELASSGSSIGNGSSSASDVRDSTASHRNSRVDSDAIPYFTPYVPDPNAPRPRGGTKRPPARNPDGSLPRQRTRKRVSFNVGLNTVDGEAAPTRGFFDMAASKLAEIKRGITGESDGGGAAKPKLAYR